MKLRRLPRGGPWEIDLVQVPEVRIEGVDLEGILFVVDAQERLLRQVTPVRVGEPLRKAVLKAAQSPPSPLRPSRPRGSG